MLLEPRLAVLDETDSGLDIDGIRTVAKGINSVVKETENGALIITHYSRILEHVNPDRVHVMIGGRIVASGGPSSLYYWRKTVMTGLRNKLRMEWISNE